MKTYSFRKQTQRDFQDRVKRLDPALAGHAYLAQGKDKTVARPVFWTLTGFGWFYLVITISNNKDFIQQSLLQGSLPAKHHDMIMTGLGIMLAVSGVMLLLHVFRFLAKRGSKRTNSKGLLIGALVAVALVYTPASVFEAGLGLLDENSLSFLSAARSTVTSSVSGTVPSVDWDNIALVSSLGK